MTVQQAADTLHALGWGAMKNGDAAAATAYWESELLVRLALASP